MSGTISGNERRPGRLVRVQDGADTPAEAAVAVAAAATAANKAWMIWSSGQGWGWQRQPRLGLVAAAVKEHN
jgi:hypothetical protein